MSASRPPAAGRSAAAAVAAARRSRSNRARRRRQIVLWAIVAVLAGSVAFAGGLFAAPVDTDFQPTPPQSVLLLDEHGKVFATLRSPQVEQPVAQADIPEVMRQAIVAAEDERFFDHRGVDPLAAVRATWRDLTGRHLQGGSTITQQYVKNVYTGSQRTALRKLREASLAVRLEQHLTKDEILTRYLNTLYLGNGTAGVQAASRFYFGVDVKDLDLDPATRTRSGTLALARASTLAGMAPAPSAWNPVADPTQARKRQLYVLNRMIANGMISSEQASAAYGNALPTIVKASAPDAPTIAPEFRDQVADDLAAKAFPDSTLYNTGGVRVTTTLDLTMQQAAVDALHRVLPKATDPEAAVVAVDPRTGDVRALAQKKDTAYTKAGFDIATNAYRSSGSTIKPFTLALALEKGHSLDEGHPAPPCLTVARGYRACNAEEGSSYQTLRSALVESINTVYAPLAYRLGVGNVISLAHRAGMKVGTLNNADCGQVCPSYSLGIPVTPLSEAVAFGTLTNGGIHHDARYVLHVDSADDGRLFSAPSAPAGQRVIPAKVADAVRGVLKDVVDDGTGTKARQPDAVVYGKTGTTDDFTNAWFTGCTPTICLAVWMGYDNEFIHGKPHSMLRVEGVDKVFGGELPAKIFSATLARYKVLSAPHPAARPSASPTPSRTSRPYVPAPRHTPSVVRHSRTPTPAPHVTTGVPRPTRSSPAPPPTTQPPLLPPPSSSAPGPGP